MTKITTETPVEQSAVDEDAQAEADFAAGAAMDVPGPKTPAQTDGQQSRDDAGRFASPKPEPKPADKPEYIQLTKQQFERFEKAAKLTDDVENKFSKAFGTIGDVQKIVRGLQGQTPRGLAVKIPAGAFDAMKKDFPELADHVQAAMEATLKGVEGTGSASAHVDTEAFEKNLQERVLKLASEDLEDEFPDWGKIVGAVDVRKGERPDPNNAFRKWLATKDQAYQTKINSANSAGVITRAIRAFLSETKQAPATAKPDPWAQARASRIQEAVRPKGDGGHPPAKGADDEFEAGFRAG